MAFYLVKEAATGKKRLVEASAPANAIAHCAKDAFTAQRVDGAVLDSLKEVFPVEAVAKPKVGEGEEPAGDPPAGEAGEAGDGKPGTKKGASGDADA
jgi:hypothetical protein